MAKQEKADLTWQDVDPDTIKGNKAYDEYKKAQKAAAEKREIFEVSFIEAARKKGRLAADETLRFSYRFGKLAVAKDKADAPKSGKTEAFRL